MYGPKELEVTSRKTKRIALLALIINGIESLVGGYGCRGVRAKLNNDELTVCYRACDEEPEEGYELDEALNYGLLSSYTLDECDEGITLGKLYYNVANELIRTSASILSSFALRTRAEGIEYMLVIFRDGLALLLRGERNKVVIPAVKAVASVHTHPEGCVPSPHDIRSLINNFLEGGIGGGIISTDCKLFILRSGPFTEDDYLAISRFRKELGARNINFLKQRFAEGTISQNLRIFILR